MNDVSYWYLQQHRGSLDDNYDPNSYYLLSFVRARRNNRRTNKENPQTDKPSFTLKGAYAGARLALPLAFADSAFGIGFGVMARQANLSLLEAALMSGTVSAGTAQLVALESWSAPLPVFAIIVTTLIVNLRHLLMGISVSPYFSGLSPVQWYGTAFFMSDETWALTIREFEQKRLDAAFMLGAGVLLLITWVGGTIIGHSLGATLGKPEKYGLDFVFVALFIVLLMGAWKGRANLLPWLVAGTMALLAAHFLPGKWYILAGGIAGSLIGGWRDAR